MIISSDPIIPQDERVQPFLSNHAFAAEAIGSGVGWWYGRKAKKTLLKGIDFKKQAKEALRASQPGVAGFNRRAYYTSKAESKTLLGISKRFNKPAKVLGFASVAALGVEAGSWMFGKATAYHSAERARRLASYSAQADTPYYDTRAAATMRQRALQVIHNSQLSTRAAFGSEASYLHN